LAQPLLHGEAISTRPRDIQEHSRPLAPVRS
jgi:hypothetical protein